MTQIRQALNQGQLEPKSIPELVIVYLLISTLVENCQNARTHTKRQIRKIAASIRRFGFVNPVIIDGNNRIIAGHGRVRAAKLLGLERVPTILLENLTKDEIRAYVLADNRLAELAGWDKEILAIELQHLLTIGEDLVITDIGFEMAEVDLMLQEAKAEKNDPADEVIIDETAQAVTSPDDLWQLGKHRILCGSAIQECSFIHLMEGRRADVVFIDPPYNVQIDGNVCGKGTIHHREFKMAAGEMSEAEFVAFLVSALRLLTLYSVVPSVHFVCMDWRHIKELMAAGDQCYSDLLNMCVWVKNNGGMGSLYRSRHELVFVFRNGRGAHRNNVMLGQYGRNRTNVWEYAGVNILSRQGDEGNLLALHPTCKPINLVADALLDCSARGDLVLDSFLGSGTTLIAAERVGRVCHGIEIDPLYVDVAIRRWQRHTGDRAIHVRTGKCFDELASALEVHNAQAQG
jgi:DNA modification methylase